MVYSLQTGIWSDHTKYGIGMKNIKTSLAVFLSVGISYLLQLEFPFFTAISTIFTIESSRETPMKAGGIRMLGSLVGACVGVVLVLVKPGNVFLCGFGIMVISCICSMLKLDRAIPIAGVIFMAIMLGKDIKDPLQYSINRILNTFAGIVVAVAVDYAVPSGGKDKDSKDGKDVKDSRGSKGGKDGRGSKDNMGSTGGKDGKSSKDGIDPT